MHVAAYYGNVSVVVMLLQNGGSPDVTNMVSKFRTVNGKQTGTINRPPSSAVGIRTKVRRH